MTKKRREMTQEHKAKLSKAYWERKRAKERGVHIPTVQEKREAARKAKEPITEQSVKELIQNAPVTEENTRINTPEFFKTETADVKRHPMRFREQREKLEHLTKK